MRTPQCLLVLVILAAATDGVGRRQLRDGAGADRGGFLVGSVELLLDELTAEPLLLGHEVPAEDAEDRDGAEDRAGLG